jgi:hypothetical protein
MNYERQEQRTKNKEQSQEPEKPDFQNCGSMTCGKLRREEPAILSLRKNVI